MNCPRCNQTLIKGETTCWQCGHNCSGGYVPQETQAAEPAMRPDAMPPNYGRPGIGAGIMSFPSTLISRLIRVTRFDIGVFEEIAICRPWPDILFFIAFNAFFSLILAVGMTALAAPAGLVIMIPLALVDFALSLIFSIVGIVLIGGLEHILIKLMGGERSLLDTLAVFGYLSSWEVIASVVATPFILAKLNIIGVILGLIISIATIVENIHAMARVHNISSGKAAAAVIATIIIVVIVGIILALIFLASLGTLIAMSGISPPTP